MMVSEILKDNSNKRSWEQSFSRWTFTHLDFAFVLDCCAYTTEYMWYDVLSIWDLNKSDTSSRMSQLQFPALKKAAKRCTHKRRKYWPISPQTRPPEVSSASFHRGGPHRDRWFCSSRGLDGSWPIFGMFSSELVLSRLEHKWEANHHTRFWYNVNTVKKTKSA